MEQFHWNDYVFSLMSFPFSFFFSKLSQEERDIPLKMFFLHRGICEGVWIPECRPPDVKPCNFKYKVCLFWDWDTYGNRIFLFMEIVFYYYYYLEGGKWLFRFLVLSTRARSKFFLYHISKCDRVLQDFRLIFDYCSTVLKYTKLN